MPVLGFHETRNTRHESRLFCRVGRQVMREGGQARRIRGGMYEARENEWKGVYQNPETGITTYTESGFGSRPGISHNIPQCVGKIRISPCRQSGAPEHCGNRDIGFMDASRPRVTFPGPQVSPSGKVKGERVTNRETQPLTRREPQASANSEVFTKHETQNRNHGLWGFHESRNTAFPATTATPRRATPSPTSRFFTNHETRITEFLSPGHGFPVHDCSAKNITPEPVSPLRPHRQRGLYGSSRDTKRGFSQTRPECKLPWSNGRTTCLGFGVTNHETRDANHGFFRRGCTRDAQSETPARTVAHAARSLLSCALWCGMARQWRGMGGRRPPFWMGLTKSAVRWKSHKNAQNPGSHRKMREAQRQRNSHRPARAATAAANAV